LEKINDKKIKYLKCYYYFQGLLKRIFAQKMIFVAERNGKKPFIALAPGKVL
jgi:hypothetical protein